MSQRRQRLRLFLEAVASLGLLIRLIVREHLLDHAQPVKGLGIRRQIDGAHAAGIEPPNDPVLAVVHRLTGLKRLRRAGSQHGATTVAEPGAATIVFTTESTLHRSVSLPCAHVKRDGLFE